MFSDHSLLRIALAVMVVTALSSCGFGLRSAGCNPAASEDGNVPGTPGNPPARAEAGARWTSPMDGMVLVYVPEGSFMMGASADDPYALDRERPAHEVYLSAFWIDSTEVTNGMYGRCVADGACSLPAEGGSHTRRSYFTHPSCGGYPVIHVTWQQAHDYCEWAGRRLPTEAEWEKAARGTEGRLFPWGNGMPTEALANLCGNECGAEPREQAFDDGFEDTSPVGHFAGDLSPYGAFDMAGNVDEWVADRGQVDYYSVSPREDPTGPVAGDTRVIRGGVFAINPRGARLTVRSFLIPTNPSEYTGFRCAVSAP